MAGIRDKVTDLIFRARVVGHAAGCATLPRDGGDARDVGGYGVGENVAATAGTEPQSAKPRKRLADAG